MQLCTLRPSTVAATDRKANVVSYDFIIRLCSLKHFRNEQKLSVAVARSYIQHKLN